MNHFHSKDSAESLTVLCVAQSIIHVINEMLIPPQAALEAYVISEEDDIDADDIVVQEVNAS